MENQIDRITKTCGACPAQWEIEMKDGSIIYVRYRWGRLGIGRGKNLHEAVNNRTYIVDIGDPLDGTLDEETMLLHLETFLNKKKMKTLNLKIDHFELGYLYACIKQDEWDRMPRKLWLKLHILSTEAYLGHPSFGKQAKKDVLRWKKELEELEKTCNK
jgi:hypothetical protein